MGELFFQCPKVEGRDFKMLIFNIGMIAKFLGVHRNTVTNWINSKKLPAKPGAAKRYTISKADFIRFCENKNIPKEVMAQIISETSAPPDACGE